MAPPEVELVAADDDDEAAAMGAATESGVTEAEDEVGETRDYSKRGESQQTSQCWSKSAVSVHTLTRARRFSMRARDAA